MSAAVLAGPARADAVAVLANMTGWRRWEARVNGKAKITSHHRERLAVV